MASDILVEGKDARGVIRLRLGRGFLNGINL